MKRLFAAACIAVASITGGASAGTLEVVGGTGITGNLAAAFVSSDGALATPPVAGIFPLFGQFSGPQTLAQVDLTFNGDTAVLEDDAISSQASRSSTRGVRELERGSEIVLGQEIVECSELDIRGLHHNEGGLYFGTNHLGLTSG